MTTITAKEKPEKEDKKVSLLLGALKVFADEGKKDIEGEELIGRCHLKYAHQIYSQVNGTK